MPGPSSAPSDVGAPPPAALSLPALDINSLFSKLVAVGIINKKAEEDKMEKIPDLTLFRDELLKV